MGLIDILKEHMQRKKRSKMLVSNLNINVVEGFFDQIKDIICIADYEGTIEYINNGEIYNKYTKLKQVLLYDQYNELIYEEIISKTLEEGSYIGEVELNKDDSKINVYIACYNMTSQRKLLVYIKNLTEYFEKELELRKEVEKKDEYLRTKDLFIANLSHEIRTPINIIVGMLYFLKSTELNESQIEYIGKLEQASNLLLEIVNNILDLSKEKRNVIVNNNVNFNLKAFLDNLSNLFEPKAEAKNLKLYITADYDTDIDIYADKTRVGQIFLNLINNSIKYTDKGFIEVLCRKTQETSYSYRLQFCVKDTGRGIKREDSLKIFTEFEQTEDPTTKDAEGTGMGLAITKKIIESMDGKIWVESNVDLGSKFYFNILVNKSTAESKSEEENKEEEKVAIVEEQDKKEIEKLEEGVAILKDKYRDIDKSVSNLKDEFLNETNKDKDNEEILKTKRVLVVEDNIINQEITKRLIEEMGITCETVIDGTECLKYIEQVGKEYFNLILMDIHMPKHNGYEIARILKDNMDVKTPIIALTATNITQEVVEENREYISSYLQKPIIPVEFKKKIKEILSSNNDDKNIFSFIDAYDEVMERLGHSQEMFKKLINIFYSTYVNIRQDLDNIKNNSNEKYIYIHSLKGAMGNLGCKRMYDQLAEIELELKTEEFYEDRKLNRFLNEFDNILKELRESPLVKSEIKKILIITSHKANAEKIKKDLYKFFEIFTAKKPNDIYLILDTQKINAIIIDKLDNIEEEIEFIKTFKLKDQYRDIPIIIFNEDMNSALKTTAMDLGIDEILETDLTVDTIKWHIQNIVDKKQTELKMKQDLNKSNKEIEDVYEFLYSSLVNLTAYKSKETGQHLLRTKEYMKRMLKEYENFYKENRYTDNKTVEDIAIAATLHDIGKVGIPDNILNKPGRLTDEEYAIMKEHVTIGRDTLEGTYGNKLSNNVLKYAKDIVYHHHEKYNGTGYPEGLKHDEITVESRIMAIIDVYDALVNDRIYKKAMPYEEAEEFIINQSGTAFDPKMINIFKIVKEDLRKINDENRDTE